VCVGVGGGLKQISIAGPLNGGKCHKLSTKTVDYYTLQYKVVM